MPFRDPKFPVVVANPTVDDCIKSTRFSDVVTCATVTAASWYYGFATAKVAKFPNANCAAALGFTAGTFLVLQYTRARLLGYQENAKEFRAYGGEAAATPGPIKQPLNWKAYN
eukprot:CAMPEP_0118701586 /NCGR_PEP_ID=MMETSP0800-20121206/17344_1 /TAXON_ID=210618 ORGANISM="Striatella unipunctata, Strain CCMP2910" /NCGR_SAMPLE_ID=MMETSP0800 /ASSEMBLY_ACC=CAM_ASM_000638 /LENGTH=112 /DNA_ID=CAMNT_0006602545 /DNA_START=96 /DNA_END=434 /DNA_ORIENTATION=-